MMFRVIEYFDTGGLVEGNSDPIRSPRDFRVFGISRPLIG